MNFKQLICLVLVGVAQALEGQKELEMQNVNFNDDDVKAPLTVTLNFEDIPNNININFIRSPTNRHQAEFEEYRYDNNKTPDPLTSLSQTKEEQSFSKLEEQFLKEIQGALTSQKDELIEAIEKNIKPTKQQIIQNDFDEHLNWLSGRTYANCPEALSENQQQSGVYLLNLGEKDLKPFGAYCMFDEGKAWTIIQRRQDGAVNFYRNWNDYKNGFGDLNGEYWLGLDRIHVLTSKGKHELWLHMKNYKDQSRSLRYGKFFVADESESYKLEVGEFIGENVDDDLLNYNNKLKFTTFDRDHSKAYYNCAENRKGAWWYDNCSFCNPNGEYKEGNDGTGIHCGHWHDPAKYFHIAIRQVASTEDAVVEMLKKTATTEHEDTTEEYDASTEFSDSNENEETTTELTEETENEAPSTWLPVFADRTEDEEITTKFADEAENQYKMIVEETTTEHSDAREGDEDDDDDDKDDDEYDSSEEEFD